jgi:hypothetical protein
MNVRKSRQIVPFDENGEGWKIKDSVDASSPPPHILKKHDPNSFLPPLKRSKSPILVDAAPPQPPNQPHSRPFTAPNPTQTDVDELRREIKSLQVKLLSAEKMVTLQRRLIDGFAKLRIDGGAKE